MDTSDLGKLNTLNTLQVARRGLDKASCLNEVHSIPRCSEQQQSSLQKKKKMYTYKTFVVPRASGAGQMLNHPSAEALMYKRREI